MRTVEEEPRPCEGRIIRTTSPLTCLCSRLARVTGNDNSMALFKVGVKDFRGAQVKGRDRLEAGQFRLVIYTR